MRTVWLRAGSSMGSIPAGTSSGRRVTAKISSGAPAQLSQQRGDVGLVAGPMPPEDVRVDRDPRHAAPRGTRRRAPWPRALQVNSAARARPSGPSSSRRSTACAEAESDRVRVERVDPDRDAFSELAEGRARGCDHRSAAGHRLQHREAETLVERHVGNGGRAAVLPRQLAVVDLAEPAHVVAADADAAPPFGADDAELEAVEIGPVERLDQPRQVLARLERGDREDVVAALGRPVGSVNDPPTP